jgi:hypothetical protein
MEKIKNIKKFLLFFSIIAICVIVSLLFFKKEDKEKILKINLAKFAEEYSKETKRTISCDGEMVVKKSQIIGNYSCIAYPPYSSSNMVWTIVARGKISGKNWEIDTLLSENASEEERLKRLYSWIIDHGNSYCEVPCYDSLSPYSYDFKIFLVPSWEELREMFLRLNYNEFDNLVIYYNASVILSYEVKERNTHNLSYGFRMPWIIPGNFSLRIKIEDGIISNYSLKIGSYENRNRECDSCEVNLVSENEIQIKGYLKNIDEFGDYPFLILEWKEK